MVLEQHVLSIPKIKLPKLKNNKKKNINFKIILTTKYIWHLKFLYIYILL